MPQYLTSMAKPTEEQATPGREFQFTVQDFTRICDLIRKHAGISLGESKLDLVYGRLSRRLRATGIRTFAEYLQLLERGDRREWEAFTNALTTNHTAFFREPHHFELLAEQLRTIKARGPIVLWCSAASTGEEAYSMAMTAVDALGSATPGVVIIATDIDTEVLETAKSGLYPLERVARLDRALVQRHFIQDATVPTGQVKVKPEIRNLVTFRQLNLLQDPWPIRPPLDAIFCRNVMIYFDRDTQLGILKKFAPLLRRDGLLYAGHSERFNHAEDYFRLRGRTVYEVVTAASSEKLSAADGKIR
jgi:chemotaxis protein methyltransferase CheR